ncbi:Avr1b-1 avirulence-like protein [Phytophthora sojae]|uniref:RxLR effector protein n=2 Tax=Phytophthora sojae TaxID=67593 RepID=G4YHS3_PHYSP|nr:Avr1b-1 avirulence-like protein [Phytophthora sojae]AEK80693.1 Avh115 [Phytophthora sojae]AEK80695.1 Avh115 [Phytophthora sojae]EGZ29650.1 Avr1b-1 avirulence-like protein [Phytophthora sojae]|eukprot:XP_009516925.1 Avr1b-1 avirulence-like protein [Phytophthora sojae]
MRLCYLLLLAAATLLASANAVPDSKVSTSDDSLRTLIDDIHVSSKRHLRAADNDEERAVPILGKLTSYLNQKTLDLWLFQGKDPKEVFRILKLVGLKGRAVQHKRWKYYVRYLNMWKDARKNAA